MTGSWGHQESQHHTCEVLVYGLETKNTTTINIPRFSAKEYFYEVTTYWLDIRGIKDYFLKLAKSLKNLNHQESQTLYNQPWIKKEHQPCFWVSPIPTIWSCVKTKLHSMDSRKEMDLQKNGRKRVLLWHCFVIKVDQNVLLKFVLKYFMKEKFPLFQFYIKCPLLIKGYRFLLLLLILRIHL